MKTDFRKVWLTLTATRPMWGMIPLRIVFGTMLVLEGLSRYLLIRQDPATWLSALPGEMAVAIVIAFGVIEIVGGILIIPGFLSRFIGFFIVLEMSLTIALERIPLDFSYSLQTQVLLLAMASMIMFSGAGRYSIDRYIARRLLKRIPSLKKELYTIAETPYTKWWE